MSGLVGAVSATTQQYNPAVREPDARLDARLDTSYDLPQLTAIVKRLGDCNEHLNEINGQLSRFNAAMMGEKPTLDGAKVEKTTMPNGILQALEDEIQRYQRALKVYTTLVTELSGLV